MQLVLEEGHHLNDVEADYCEEVLEAQPIRGGASESMRK